MPEIIQTTLYQFHELSEPAKERARSWYRETALDPDWYDAVFADFAVVCEILGLDLKTSTVRLIGGGTRRKPCLYFQGFGSQGDGACFEGVYTYARQAPAKIRRYAPQDAGLHRIADILQAVQRRNFYRLRAENPPSRPILSRAMHGYLGRARQSDRTGDDGGCRRHRDGSPARSGPLVISPA